VLDNINTVFKPGKTYLILGPPKSGKSTLLKAVAGKLLGMVVNVGSLTTAMGQID